MRRALLLTLVVLALPAAAAAQDPVPTATPTATPEPTPAPEPRIREGVFAGGVDLSNLTVPEATAKLQQALSPVFAQDVVVEVAKRTYRVRPGRIDFSFDAERTARRAYQAGEAAPPPEPSAGGTPPTINVAVAVEFRRMPIRALTRKIDKQVYVKPRDASIRITVSRIFRKSSRAGRDLEAQKLATQIEAAFSDPVQPRLIKPGRRKVTAKVRVKDLAKVYGTVVTIDRGTFKLRVFKRLRLSKTYGVAVGAVGYDTPAGRYSVQNKAVNPVWTAPNKPWAGLYAGSSIPGGSSENPLKARWLGIVGGVGIHGTAQEWSIGSRASHGCIRMRVADVIDLYPRVPVGSPVLIR
jgi:lipoprotein-anchoring transpeptidase ErfK/SrfK